MALSLNAAKALEQVKMGLYMLYGADYFTEDEWIKIDCLLHKGKYVLTNGPAQSFPYEEELISFGESKDEMESTNIDANSMECFERFEKNTIVVSEEQIPSPSSSDAADSHFNQDETTNATSAEHSSEEETAPNPSSNESPIFDFSEQTATASAEPFQPQPQPETQSPGSSGLPTGITQEQLDQARMMQASMTKAGQKSKPKYKRDEGPLAESRWAEDLPLEQTVEEAYPSPAPSERDTRITSWASEVNAQQPPASGIESPAPAKKTVDPKALAEEFVKRYGRKPKSINDFYQPNNPAHFSNLPTSGVSDGTAKTPKATPVAPKNAVKISPGSTYVAQSAQSKNHGSDLRLDIQTGDHIKVIKYVSGVMWVGTNSRTKQTGQFSESIFKKSAAAPKSESAKPIQSATAAPTVASSSIRNGLENVEWTNAAEWDDVHVKSGYNSVTTAPAPVRPALAGLSSSRFSVVEDRSEPKPQVPAQNGITFAMKREFGKMVDEKVDEILKARGMAATPAPAPSGPSRSQTFNGTLQTVQPKKNTCWFWAKNKGCRFTAEECRDLHGYLPNAASEPTNLHLGRPTWGALADSSSTVGHVDPNSFTVPQVASPYISPEQKKGMTCWYWARDGNCEYSAENCKYLHAHASQGVAPRPWKKLPSWGAHTWRRPRDGEMAEDGTLDGEGTVDGWGEENEGDDSGEMVLEEVSAEESMSVAGWGVIGDGGAGGWGRDTPVQDVASSWGGQDDRYKPPHIKALEQKAIIEAVGW